MKYYLAVWKKFADFSGRARRKEYWMFFLFSILAYLVAMGIDYSLGTGFKAPSEYGEIKLPYGYIFALYAVASLVPSLAVTVRRLHDVGKSGWFYFISLIPLIGSIWLLVLVLTDSQPETNKWGPNPKRLTSEPEITY
ncbi:MAG: DUF805 domain-containing protein [Chitinophagaceae bacterium]